MVIRCVQFEYFNTGRPDHVAFFDTVTDRFVEFGGEQAWSSKAEFDACIIPLTIDIELVERLMNLTPLWFWDNQEGRDDG